MKYHVLSGDIKMQVEAPTVESAFIAMLKVSPLDQCSIFVCGFEHGKEFTDPDTMWSLTEFYLEKAGYEKVEGNKWRHKNPILRRKDRLRLQNTVEHSSGTGGVTAKKEKVVPTQQHSLPAPTLKTGSTERSMRGGRRQRTTKKVPAKDLSETMNMGTHPVTKVNLNRTPEEWAELLAQARGTRFK